MASGAWPAISFAEPDVVATSAGPDRLTARDDALRRYYARRAPVYDAIYARPERQADLRAMEAWLPPLFGGARLFELVCGTGYWTRLLAPSARSVVALDGAGPALAIARERLAVAPALAAAPVMARVDFVLGDAWRLPFAPRSFDAAFAGHWFSHVPRRRRDEFFAGLARVLAPGALVVLLDNRYVEGSSTPIAETDEAGDSWQERPRPGGGVDRVLKNFPGRDELQGSLEGHGELIDWRTWTHYWACSIRLAGRAVDLPAEARSRSGPTPEPETGVEPQS